MPKVQDTYVRNAKVLKVVDGDTVKLEVDLGCDIGIKMTCRLDGINAPEKATAEGKVAKAWLELQLPENTPVVVQTVKDRKEKYGRYLAVVYLPVSDISLNDQLVSNGLAKSYHGEARN